MSFMKKIESPQKKKLSFHLAHIKIIGSMKYENTRNDFFHDNTFKNINSRKDYAEKSIETTVKEILSQRWGGNRKLSM